MPDVQPIEPCKGELVYLSIRQFAILETSIQSAPRAVKDKAFHGGVPEAALEVARKNGIIGMQTLENLLPVQTRRIAERN